MGLTIERLAAALADRYRIERELGAGGMATVYLAEDPKHKRRVAVTAIGTPGVPVQKRLSDTRLPRAHRKSDAKVRR